MVGNLSPAPKGLIPAIIFNDDGLALGKTPIWEHGSSVTADVGDLTGFFDDDGPLTYVETIMTQAAGGLNSEVTLTQSADGVYTVELAGDATLLRTADPNHFTTTAAMSYGNTVVEVMASDAEDLWTSQTFHIRRNRAPVIRDQAAVPEDGTGIDHGRYSGTDEHPIVLGTAGDDVTLEIDTGDYFFYDDDQLTVTAEVDDPNFATVSVDGDVITLTAVKGTEGGFDTRILLRATDTGGLTSQQFAYALQVDTGPSVKAQPDDVTFTLEAEGTSVYVVDIDRFFTAQPAGTEVVTYAAESSNVSVATVTAAVEAVGTQGGAGPDLTIQVESIGETTIKLTATEPAVTTNPRTVESATVTAAAARPFGNPAQTASVEFKVNVVAE